MQDTLLRLHLHSAGYGLFPNVKLLPSSDAFYRVLARGVSVGGWLALPLSASASWLTWTAMACGGAFLPWALCLLLLVAALASATMLAFASLRWVPPGQARPEHYVTSALASFTYQASAPSQLSRPPRPHCRHQQRKFDLVAGCFGLPVHFHGAISSGR